MAPTFTVIEHVVPGQHIREYPGATRHSQEDILKIHVKQYVPANAPDSIPTNALTIIGAHGIGFPKVGQTCVCREHTLAQSTDCPQETYEPLWEDIYFRLQSHGIHVRSIWMADCSNQGASGVLNENIQGDSSKPCTHHMIKWLNQTLSLLVRPFSGLASYDQPLSKLHASSFDWRGS